MEKHISQIHFSVFEKKMISSNMFLKVGSFRSEEGSFGSEEEWKQ